MSDKAVFTALAEILEVPNTDIKKVNPLLTIARFIFADDKGAPLSTADATPLQGIEFEDFDEVIDTAMHMPVKMNFSGEDVARHEGAYVIGHISKMEKAVAEDGTNQLVAEAVLYKDEYPQEVKWLKEKYDAGEAPGISYEIAYGSSIIKNGVEWLKNLITAAATFVKSPAYGKRTALLALASAKTDEEFVSTMKTFVAQAEGTQKETIEGGINVDELEKVQQEAATYKAEAETKAGEITRLMDVITAKDAEISSLNDNVATLTNEKKLETRQRMFTEAGFMLEADAEKSDKKKAFWLTLSDESFDEYLADLVAAKAMATSKELPDKKAEAASRLTALPKPEFSQEGLEVPSFRFRE